MRYGYTILYVDDVPATVTAWEHAFGLRRKMLTDDGDYGELNTGPTTISFAQREFGRGHFDEPEIRALFDGSPRLFEVGFVIDDVEAAYERALGGGMAPVVHPTEKPWGQTVAWVQDPNGFLIELASPMEE